MLLFAYLEKSLIHIDWNRNARKAVTNKEEEIKILKELGKIEWICCIVAKIH